MESAFKYRLKDIYRITISPRTPEIKSNEFIIKSSDSPGEDFLPILSSMNLKQDSIDYTPLKELWIHKTNMDSLRMCLREPHIIIGHGFRGDKNLAVAYESKGYPWMGDVYHLFRYDVFENCIESEDEEIAEYLRSNIVKTYIQDKFKDVTFHLSISQIKEIPIYSDRNDLKNFIDV